MREDFMVGIRFLLTFSFIFFLMGCPEQQIGNPVTNKAALVGKWENGFKAFEVFEEGKIVITDKIKRESTTGSYTFVNNIVFRLNLGVLGTHEYKAFIHEEQLFLTSLDGKYSIGYNRHRKLSD